MQRLNRGQDPFGYFINLVERQIHVKPNPEYHLMSPNEKVFLILTRINLNSTPLDIVKALNVLHISQEEKCWFMKNLPMFRNMK